MSVLPLRQCLEQVAALGADYILTDQQGREWTATRLLASLPRDHPDSLGLLAYLRLPDVLQDGAICQVTQSGGFLRWYRIHRKPRHELLDIYLLDSLHQNPCIHRSHRVSYGP
jgi:hypothetical protein